VDLHHLHGRIRRLVAPQVLDETLDAYRAVDVKQQPCEEARCLAPPKGTAAAPS
jgi:hypothetical protein